MGKFTHLLNGHVEFRTTRVPPIPYSLEIQFSAPFYQRQDTEAAGLLIIAGQEVASLKASDDFSVGALADMSLRAREVASTTTAAEVLRNYFQGQIFQALSTGA